MKRLGIRLNRALLTAQLFLNSKDAKPLTRCWGIIRDGVFRMYYEYLAIDHLTHVTDRDNGDATIVTTKTAGALHKAMKYITVRL